MSKGGADAAASAKVEYQHRLDRGTKIALAALLLPVMALAIVIAEATKAHAEDRVEPYRAAREAYIRDFHVSGRHDLAPLAPLEHDLRLITATTAGEVQARALFELGSVERLSNEFPESVSTLTRAAELATRLGRQDIAFDAWVSVRDVR
jgi:hypothetical protein